MIPIKIIDPTVRSTLRTFVVTFSSGSISSGGVIWATVREVAKTLKWEDFSELKSRILAPGLTEMRTEELLNEAPMQPTVLTIGAHLLYRRPSHDRVKFITHLYPRQAPRQKMWRNWLRCWTNQDGHIKIFYSFHSLLFSGTRGPENGGLREREPISHFLVKAVEDGDFFVKAVKVFRSLYVQIYFLNLFQGGFS